MKKKLLPIFILLFSSFLFSVSIEKSFYFDKPLLQKNGHYVILKYKNCINYEKEGYPLLPHYNVNLLLPAGEEIQEITIEKIEYYPYIQNVNLEPASAQFPISRPVKNYHVIPNKKVYQSEYYPKSHVEKFISSFLSGHSIGSFEIVPIRFFPNEKKLLAIKNIVLKIKTIKTIRAKESLKNFKDNYKIRKRLQNLVCNYDKISNFYSVYNNNSTKNEVYDYLIITNQELSPAFANFVEYKESTGYFVALETVENIYDEYNGRDNQEKIRNCIIDYYQNYGIEYVLLGGDSDSNNSNDNIVPLRGMTVTVGYSAYDENNLPADIYYSNLDGSWNEDNDNNWGEVGEIDYYSEVSIGRLCVDSAQEVENFTNKIIMYENQPYVPDIKKALMLGEKLDDAPTYGGDYKDEVADGSNNNNYYSAPIPDDYQITKLYERDNVWTKYDVFDQFSSMGVHLLNHLGHSNPHYNMKISTNDLTTDNLTNDGINHGFVIGYSQGCYNGSFDNWIWEGYYLDEDCFAEDITNMSTGEVATIANSRFGWYSSGHTNSSSQYYDREFYNSIFGVGIYNIGKCNSYSKELNPLLIHNYASYRWSAFETNLFGDPSMDIWTDVPTDFQVVSYPSAIKVGSDHVEIILSEPNSRVAITKDGELIGRTIEENNAIANIQFTHPINEICTLSLSVTAHNKNRYIGEINVIPEDSPFLSVLNIGFEEIYGNNNQVIDHGEKLNLFFDVKNFGSQDATNVTATIFSDNPYIEILNGMVNLGNIGSGETIENEDNPFVLKISPFCPDNIDIPINIILSSDEGEWNNNKILNVKAPLLYLDSYDLFTNEYSYILPGDLVHLRINLKNEGNGIANFVKVKMVANDSFVDVIQDTILVEEILPFQEAEFYNDLTFSVSENCPDIYNINLTLEVSDSLGYFSTYQIPVDIGYKNTVEENQDGWIHYSLNEMVDQWHITESRSFSPTHSWKMGSHSQAYYFNNLKCALETPEMEIEPNLYFSFYHWMYSETSTTNISQCYDGGLVQIYYNNFWQTLIPINGYPYTTTGNNNVPFENGTGVFSGYINWERVYFDLSSYIGTVKFRFLFGSDGSVTYEGWYIDDIGLVSSVNTVLSPNNLIAISDSNQVLLSWQDNQQEIESYNIYRKLMDDENYQLIGNSDVCSFVDVPDISGTYIYVVTAIKDNQESLFSNAAIVQFNYLESDDNVIYSQLVSLINYPNPFNPLTNISFNVLNNESDVKLIIYNLKGERVKSLINEKLKHGLHTFVWEGKNDLGKKVSSGVYFCKLKIDNKVYIRKMLIIK